MQLLRLSSPVILSVLVLLLNFSILTSASPISLYPRDDVTCPQDYGSCQSETGAQYCCPPSHACAANAGCAAVIPTTESSTPTSTPTSTPAPTASSSAANSSENDKPFFTTKVIIAVSTGGGIALLLIIIGCWACHRKRQQGRALLAAYESPDRKPYEVISLKTKKSTQSFNDAAPPAPTAPTVANPGTSASTTFNIPQHTATPPPDYKNRSSTQAVDEKELFPRYPPQTFQGQDSPTSPVGSQRGPFPSEVLRSPRVSSLQPFQGQDSPVTPTGSQRGPFSAEVLRSPRGSSLPPYSRQVSLQQVPGATRHPSFSQQQIQYPPTHAAFSQQAEFSPTQTTFSLHSAYSQTHPTEFSFAPQGRATPVTSPPTSPRTPSYVNQELFLPVENPQQPGLNQELYHTMNGHQPPGPQPQHGYPMAY